MLDWPLRDQSQQPAEQRADLKMHAIIENACNNRKCMHLRTKIEANLVQASRIRHGAELSSPLSVCRNVNKHQRKSWHQAKIEYAQMKSMSDSTLRTS